MKRMFGIEEYFLKSQGGGLFGVLCVKYFEQRGRVKQSRVCFRVLGVLCKPSLVCEREDARPAQSGELFCGVAQEAFCGVAEGILVEAAGFDQGAFVASFGVSFVCSRL